MLSVSYASKNTYSTDKTSGVLRGGASGANRGYVLAHSDQPPIPSSPLCTPYYIVKQPSPLDNLLTVIETLALGLLSAKVSM